MRVTQFSRADKFRRRHFDAANNLPLDEIVARIKSAAAELNRCTDLELRDRTTSLRELLETSEHVVTTEILVAGFALVNEAARRTLGINYYDVQFLAGIALARGSIAEMQTGEGKTFVAALPAFVQALSGNGVHVITTNDYLAQRDSELLSPVFELLGLSVGLLKDRAQPADKRRAYACDITYGPGYEFGFDYLRDQLALRDTQRKPLGTALRGRLRGESEHTIETIQRGLNFAIIDEIDSVLIDDASSPLVLSDQPNGPAEDAEAHRVARRLLSQLESERHFEVNSYSGNITLTDDGNAFIHCESVDIPFSVLLRPWSQYVLKALSAEHIFYRGVQYVVDDDSIRIVDQSTGRIFSERTWQDGLHQAVQAKESVSITAESQPLARVTKQRFFRLYGQLSGMTGTARESTDEFREFYSLEVRTIPLRNPSQRTLLPTQFFSAASDKWRAIVEEVGRIHETGQPILIGTRTIANSELLAEELRDRGVPFQLLNGTQDEEEAEIIARAGQPGIITIATNMAGRGTDIKVPQESIERGGLHVIASELHESQRIDRQLTGRAARQGDPGSARFYVSLEDDLIRRYGSWLAKSSTRLGNDNGNIAVNMSKQLSKIQQHAESTNFLRRRLLFRRDAHRDSIMTRLHGDS